MRKLPQPKISDSAVVHATAIIYDNVIIEDDVVIGAYCIIGAPAEKMGADTNKGVIIKRGAILHGLCTVDAGTAVRTQIGEFCYLMKHTHVGHDSILAKGVVIAPNATVGGFCIIEVGVGVGMNTSIHQRTIVREGCFIGQGSVIPRGFETQPYRKYVGVGRDIGENKRK
jgi:UDP-N-acetylglucosamine acyltransferase